MKKTKKMIKRIYKMVMRDEMRILPGQLAFFIVFSLIVIFSLIGLICSSYITNELMTMIEETLPKAVASIFKSAISTNNEEFNIIIFIICALYIASNGCLAMIITSNTLYHIKSDNIVKQQIKAIIMTIILIALILFMVVVPAFGEFIISLIQKHYPGRIIDSISLVFSYLKIPLSFILIYFGVKVIYTIAPDKNISSRYTTYGALFTTLGWIIATKVYSIYINNINTYNIYYGSLANIVIFLFWVYILAYIYTLGIALNTEHYMGSQEVSSKKEEKKEKVLEDRKID